MQQRRRHILILGFICLFFSFPVVAVYSVLMQTVPQSVINWIGNAPIIAPLFQITGKALIDGENAIRDSLAQNGRKTPVDDRLVYVAIDSDSLQLDTLDPKEIQASPTLTLMAQGYPWSRSVYAHILDKLFQAGARVVAVDLLFLRETPDDALLKKALDRYKDQVIIGCNFVYIQDKKHKGTVESVEFPTEALVKHSLPLDHRVAFINYFTDTDNSVVVRQAQYQKDYQGQQIPSFAARALQKFGFPEKVPQDTNAYLLRFCGFPSTYQPIPVWQLFVPEIWEKNLQNGNIFKDKIVIFGPHANWSHDEHDTPMGMMPGPEIHLNAIAAALHGEFIREFPHNFNLLLMPLSALIAWGLCFILKNPLVRLGAMTAMVFLYFVFLGFVFDHFSFYILSLPPLLIFSSSGITCLAYEFFVEQIVRSRTRATLERYVSKNVVQEILDHSKDYEQSLGGARKHVTILFSDIRGFTTMTESADSQVLVKQLNEYLTEMVECVFNHQGTLDKFIGDAVMAVWGNAVSYGAATDATHAVQSALSMRHALEKLNQKWMSENRQPLHIGIGLNHGEVIIGNMGSPKRMEFTAIGDAVNLASRLEGLTKPYHVDILIGESVAALVRDSFYIRTVALVQVKGKTKPVEVFTVLEEKNKSFSKSQTQFLDLYEQGVAFYRSRKFEEASQTFSKCLEINLDDSLSRMYLEESRHLAANPPDPSWNGVNVMTSK